ncbi:unnamed protein product [Effrenium voratum]|nr:unnamed protein product [Effrenium voratum]
MSSELVEARVVRLKRKVAGEAHAQDLSEALPFLELELHKQLVHKMRAGTSEGFQPMAAALRGKPTGALGMAEECRSALEDKLGEAPDKPRQRLEADRGVAFALAEELKNCTDELNSTGMVNASGFQECKDKALASLKLLKGTNVTKEEFEAMLRKAAEERMRMVVKECMTVASTEAEKDACFTSMEAKRAAAKISGMDPSEFKEGDLKEAMRHGAARDMAQEMQVCMKTASTNEAKRGCMKTDSLKGSVAESLGKDRDKVKDSEVREFLEEGALEDLWSLMESCPEEEKTQCVAAAKETLGTAMGKTATDISDQMLRKVLQRAMQKKLGEQMEACMEAAEDDDARKQCKDILAEAAVKVGGGEGPRGKTELALMDAGRSAAKEHGKDCAESREVCMRLLKEKAAQSMGMRPDEMTDMAVERLNMEGAKGAARDAARACAEAKEADNSATCEDVLEVFKAARKKDSDDSEERRIKQDMAKDLDKEDMKVCLNEDAKASFTACMQNIGGTEKVKDELFKDMPEARKEAKKKRAKDEAAVEAMGELFKACMESATTEEEKGLCMEEMKSKKELADLKDDVEDVVMKFQRNVVAEAARVCDKSKRKECVDAAKAELKKMGLKERAFGVVKKLAEIKAAAETYAACQEASSTENSTCIQLAQATFEEISGSTEIWDDELAAKVTDLGNAMLEGRDILIRKLKQIVVEMVSDATNCSEEMLTNIMDKVANISGGFMGKNSSNSSRNITNKLCRIAWGFGRFFCKIHTEDLGDDEMANLSDFLAADMELTELSRRLTQRRLATITETYADQESEETAATEPYETTTQQIGISVSCTTTLSVLSAVVAMMSTTAAL